MKNVLLKKSSGDNGIGTMIFSVVTLFMMIVIMMYSFHEVETTFITNALRDGVDIVCLSTVIPDMDEIVDDVKDSVTFDPNNGFGFGGITTPDGGLDVDIVVDRQATYERFQFLFEENVVKVVGNVDVSDLKVEELILYCIEGDDVSEYVYDSNGSCTVIPHPDGKGTLTSPNGVCVDDTSVYVRFTFTYKDVFGIKHAGLESENYKAVRIK